MPDPVQRMNDRLRERREPREMPAYQRALLERYNRLHRWKDRFSLVGCVLFVAAGYCTALFLITFTAWHLLRWIF